jgi:hypothetical protein
VVGVKLAQARRNGHTHALPNGAEARPACGRRLVGAEVIERRGADAVLALSCPSCLSYAVRRGWLTADLIVTDLGRSL